MGRREGWSHLLETCSGDTQAQEVSAVSDTFSQRRRQQKQQEQEDGKGKRHSFANATLQENAASTPRSKPCFLAPFLQTRPQSVTLLKEHSLSPHICLPNCPYKSHNVSTLCKICKTGVLRLWIKHSIKTYKNQAQLQDKCSPI